MTAPLLEAAGLHKHYPVRAGWGRAPLVVRAVDGVSLELARGETLGLVGESGCGKSTLARLLVRLTDPSAGTLRFAGEDVLALRGAALRAWRRRVQIVFQDAYGALNPRLRVGDAIREVLEVHGMPDPRRRTGALLEQVGLDPAQGARYPHELSGGQRQRVGIARALALEPDVLVCDEPVSALDVSVQAQILTLLQELQKRMGLALLFISHDLRVVRGLCARVAVMYLGRIVEAGPADAVFDTPRHPYTRALVDSVPEPVPGRLPRVAVQGEPADAARRPAGCAFEPRCPVKIAPCRSQDPPLADAGAGRQVACLVASAPPPSGPPRLDP